MRRSKVVRPRSSVTWPRLGSLSCVVVFALAEQSIAVEVNQVELETAGRWTAAKFSDPVDVKSQQEAALIVMANHDPVLRNTRGNGRSLTIADTSYQRGLYCHADSLVVVRLPSPGKEFSSIVGVDSNDQTIGGRGSIQFRVWVGEQKRFESPIMREGMHGQAISVPLDGASEFTLTVSDGGDGISCDQADWAEAEVELEDGTKLWLGDLPLRSGEATAISSSPPFSFIYDGVPSSVCLRSWNIERTERKLDDQRTARNLTYRDPKTALEVRCEAIEYHDFPTIEWTVFFRNCGDRDTPILSDIQAIDTSFQSDTDGEFLLHYNTGSPAAAHDYQPHRQALRPNSQRRLTTSGGRGTDAHMPYFNLQWGDQGVIAVLGWPGQWAAEFRRDAERSTRVCGGQEQTHFLLHPGEQIRTPLVVVQFWDGSWIRSQNVWRRWMITHNLPQPGGKPMPPAIMMCTSDDYPGMKSTAHGEIANVDRYLDAGAKLDYWWIDAGWYPCRDGWWNVGTWEADPDRYPNGLKEVADHVHQRGLKLVVWFEPERVTAGSWLAEQHPEWVLGGREGGLLNLGNPDAWKWLVEHIDGMIRENEIDLYRQDFNMAPLEFWRYADASDRQGITEIRHIEGYLAFWDELRRRHPEMPIDSCASGGRRNDLETLRRGFPLLRSDYRFETAGTQGHTYGMALWIPYFGTGVGAENDYVVRSHWCPWLGIGQPNSHDPQRDWSDYHRMLEELRQVRLYFLGDYYPLTDYSLDGSVWMAWQFDRSDLGRGMVQVFGRKDTPYRSAVFPLQGLEEDAIYRIRDLDSGNSRRLLGRELMHVGLPVSIDGPAAAPVLLYRKIEPCEP